MQIRTLLASTALIVAVICRAAATPTPRSVLNPIWNDGIEYLLTSGALPELYRTTRPYPRGDLRPALRRAADAGRTDFERALASRLLRELEDEAGRSFHVRARGALTLAPEQKPRVLPRIRAAFRYDHPNGATLYQEFEVVPAVGRIRVIPGGATAQQRLRSWNPFDLLPQEGYVADFSRALVEFPLAGLRIAVGRDRFFWGPGDSGALLLSDASPALDGFSVAGSFGTVRGTAVFAALNRMWHDEGGRRYLARRYFAAHRVHWKPSPRFELGIMDAILYGGESRPVEPYYLNPVLPFYASQYNASTDRDPDFLDDNAMIGFDALWNPSPGWALYGELLIDDFRYDPASNDPNALAWLAGVHRTGWKGRGEGRIEYARVDRYTYTHLVQEEQYTHFGASLGYGPGNDADLLSGTVAWWFSPDARAFVRLEQRRKGDSGVDDRFRGETQTAFLKGAAETRRALSFGGWARIGPDWVFEAEGTIGRVRNDKHRFGESVTRSEWRGSLAHTFRLDL